LIYLDQSQNQQVQVTAVQGNIPPLEKWTQGEELSLNRYDSLSRAAFNPHTALVIWPETSVPAQLEGGLYLRLCYFTDRANVTLVTGVPDYCMFGGHYRHLNGAVQIVPEKGVTARTYKKYLVPFGERVPFQWIYPGLGKLNLGQAEFLPGLRQALFTFTKDSVEVRYPVLICYESLFPELSRQAVRDGANLLVTISNDAWYGWSSEPAQIDALSRFRCIETRRSMARVSNAGISSIIDPMGTELCATGLFQTTFVTAPVPLERRTTFFVVYGEWLPVLMNVITGAALIFMAVRKRKQ